MLACNAIVGFDSDFVLVPQDDAVVTADGSAESSGGEAPDDEGGAPSPSDAGTPDAADVEEQDGRWIHCGPSTTCSVGTQTCCPRMASGYRCQSSDECVCRTAGACNGSNFHLDCDDDTDCSATQVCCGSLSNGYSLTGAATCVSAANCPAGRAHLCDVSDPRCPDGGRCRQFMDNLYPGVGRCD